MGRLIYRGSSRSPADIPQPISFVTGGNLPGTSTGNSPPPSDADGDIPLDGEGDWTEDIPPIRYDEHGRLIDPDEYRHEYRRGAGPAGG
jgi:hypothetical protein